MYKKFFTLLVLISFQFVTLAMMTQKQEYFPGDIGSGVCKMANDGRLKKIKEAVAAGYDINLQNEYGQTPLMFAAQNGHDAIVSYLLDHKANVDLENNEGYTALLLAAQAARLNTVKMLLKAGANFYAKNKQGASALILAKEGFEYDKKWGILNSKMYADSEKTVDLLEKWPDNPESISSIVQKHLINDLLVIVMSYLGFE